MPAATVPLASAPLWVSRALVVSLGVAAGLGLSTLGLIWPWVVTLVVGVFAFVLRERAAWLLWLAAGIALGGVLYVVLGLVVSGEAGTGSGGS